MKFRDISIRKKLLLSNLMMILIPVLLVLLITIGILIGFFAFTTSGNRAALLSEDPERNSNYQLQIIFDSICDEITSSAELPDRSKYIKTACVELEKIGGSVYIGTVGIDYYITQGESLVGMENEAFRICVEYTPGGTLPSFYRNEKGLVYEAVLNSPDGREIRLMMVGEGLGYHAPDYLFVERVKGYIKVCAGVVCTAAIIVIVLTGTVLTRKLSRDVLVPLEKLRRGANEIKEGNLDCEIGVAAEDELGEACRDFDSMRMRLKESIQKQEQYEDGRKELIAGISHDLSTPLTSIKGYLSGLIDGIADTPEKREHYLHTAYRMACDMDQLVDSLFLFSKLDTGRMPFHPEEVNLHDYFTDYCEEATHILHGKGIKLRYANYCTASSAVAIDRIQFSRVILNLLENSIKYKRSNVESEIEILLDNKTDGKVDLYFADNGCGVDEKEAEKLFDSFYRTDPARSSMIKGSGLGLAVTRQIVETMHGTIRAVGRLNDGLTIIISLPEVEKENGNETDSDYRG